MHFTIEYEKSYLLSSLIKRPLFIVTKFFDKFIKSTLKKFIIFEFFISIFDMVDRQC